VKLAEAPTPATAADTPYEPDWALAVKAGAIATPLALVNAVAEATPLKVALAPVGGAVNVTVMPLTGLLLESFTVACSAVANIVLMVALCGVPAVAAMLAGGPAWLVRLKPAEVETPGTLANRVHPPACPLAVNAGAVAIPLALVIAVAVYDPLKVALAPVEGAVNVTVTPLSALLFTSFTVACSAVAYTVLTVALCGAPAVALMLKGVPAKLVRPKLAEPPTPGVAATTT
jgi:hypothetical protein